MLCVGLLTRIRISGAAALRGWVVLDAGLASGTAGLELVGVPGDLDSVSAPGVAVLGVWNSEPVDDWDGVSAPGVPALGVSALGVSDSEPVWAFAGKASIAVRAATLSKRQCLRKADRRI
jgi:hypothetical protein